MYKRVTGQKAVWEKCSGRKGRGWEVGARTGEDKQIEGKEDYHGALVSVVTSSTQTQGRLGVEFSSLFMHVSSAIVRRVSAPVHNHL